MNDKINIIPIVNLQGIVMFPNSLIHFDIHDEKSQKAIKSAMNKDQLVFLTMSDKLDEEESGVSGNDGDIGIISKVKYYINLPSDSIRVLVEGISRGKIVRLLDGEEIIISEEEENDLSNSIEYAEIEYIIDEGEQLLTFHEKEALLRSLKDIFEQYGREIGTLGKETIRQITDEVSSLTELIDEITLIIPLSFEQKHEILITLDLMKRYERLSKFILDEIEIIKIKKQYQIKIKEKVDKNQKEYLLREQLKLIKEELGEEKTDYIDEYYKKLDEIIASDKIKDSIRSTIERLASIGNNTAEASVERKYIELLLELPWDKTSIDSEDLKYSKKVLEEDHYGLKEVKERIIEFLSVRILTKGGETPIICLVGPPGTGKTSIAKSVARALNKKYIKISLGGVRDEAEIRGHRRTYIGALPGRVIASLKNAGVKNPLFLLDEIDKVGSDARGDVSSALLEVLDSEQNNNFVDHYVEMPVDLSEVLFICTANSVRNIQRPLLDRMEVIEIPSYTENEKFHIGKDYLYPKQLKAHGLSKTMLTISDAAITRMISGYTKEAGVRGLERLFGKLCRKAAKEIVVDGKSCVRLSINNLDKYLGKEKYTYQKANKEDQIGIARGLAWTSMGGDTIEIEVNVMPGKGKFNITGKIGDVMKESALAGVSYIRSIGEQFDISPQFFDNNDIHIHIPEGAVPKDGPSAGVTICSAMLSAIIGKNVKADLAMTGEITIRGRVLPVGGLKEKILAAKNARISKVLIPNENKKDIEEIDSEIKDGINIVYVTHMDEVIKHAIVDKE
ncbi:MAG: endopeptidase La [Clostridiales bacterium]|nr:endopeptidase La [Clostridiales bacterium]